MVSKIEDLKCVGIQEVALSGFTPEEPFVVRLRRPSLMRLAQEGEIPNQLLGAAAELFTDGVSNMLKEGEKFQALGGAVLVLVKASLVEPTYEELCEAGIELTDSQLMDIYLYTQKGVKMLEGFREDQEAEPDTEPGEKPKAKAK